MKTVWLCAWTLAARDLAFSGTQRSEGGAGELWSRGKALGQAKGKKCLSYSRQLKRPAHTEETPYSWLRRGGAVPLVSPQTACRGNSGTLQTCRNKSKFACEILQHNSLQPLVLSPSTCKAVETEEPPRPSASNFLFLQLGHLVCGCCWGTAVSRWDRARYTGWYADCGPALQLGHVLFQGSGPCSSGRQCYYPLAQHPSSVLFVPR